MPILYEKPIAVTPEALDGKSFAPAKDYSHARSAHMVPINAPQVVDAAASFPILFTAAPAMTVAVMGLRSGENLFVEADGQWADGYPVPDYIRRYPFILRQNQGKGGFELCIDSASAMIIDGDSEPFFQNDKKSKFLEEIVETCLAYQRHSEVTHALAGAIASSGILADLDDVYTLPGGRKIRLEGFQAVDKKKLDALPDATFLEWRRNGYLDFVYLHLVSLRTWPRLFRRLARRQAAEAANG